MPDWQQLDPQLRQFSAEGVSPTAMAKRLTLARQTVVDRLRKLGLKDAKTPARQESPAPNDVVDVSPEPMTSEDANTPGDKPVSTIVDIVPVMTITAPLPPEEVQTLAHYEQIIAEGIETFVKVGHALLTIRDLRLYRERYATFEDYCRERWDLSRPRAYQLIDAANVVDAVSTTADTVPANEAQARPLTSLAPEQQREVWREVVATAPATGVIAKHVQATVKRLKGATSASRAQQERPTPDRARQAAEWRDRFSHHFRNFEGLLERFKQAGGVLVLVRDWDLRDQLRFVEDLRAQAKTLQEMAAHFEKTIIGEEAALKALTHIGE